MQHITTHAVRGCVVWCAVMCLLEWLCERLCVVVWCVLLVGHAINVYTSGGFAVNDIGCAAQMSKKACPPPQQQQEAAKCK